MMMLVSVRAVLPTPPPEAWWRTTMRSMALPALALLLTACPEPPAEDDPVVDDDIGEQAPDSSRALGLFCGGGLGEPAVATLLDDDGASFTAYAYACVAPAVAGGAACSTGGLCAEEDGGQWTFEASDGDFTLQLNPLLGVVPLAIAPSDGSTP